MDPLAITLAVSIACVYFTSLAALFKAGRRHSATISPYYRHGKRRRL